MKKVISILKLLGVWTLILLVFGVIFEIYLRNSTYVGKQTLTYTVNDQFGTWRLPNQRAVKVADCYQVDDIRVNSYGMRGAEPDDQKKIKVGFFGDSMLEGIQVNEKDHVVTRLNEANDSVDYLNFATSSTTTVYHLLDLKYHLQFFNLKKAVIFFYMNNDIQENSIPLQVAMNGKRYYYPSYVDDGNGGYKLDYNYRPSDWKNDLRLFLRKSLVFQKLYEIQTAVQMAKLSKAKAVAGQNGEHIEIPIGYQVFAKETTPEWQKAYELTDYSILQLKSFCEEKGIELEFVLVPGVGELLSEQEEKAHYQKLYPLMDQTKPYRYYTAFLTQNNIKYIDLYAAARQRIAEQKLSYPYFSYECDGHFSKAGHDLMFDVLKANGF
ncbi:MAG: hypothetical protein R2830_22345 [Saprospiraceae bacterium]